MNSTLPADITLPVERTLLVMRHAKSAWPVGVRDLDRPLNARGVRSATQAGRWLGATHGAADRIRVSPAKRTRQTWELVSAAAGIPVEAAVIDERIYEASWWDLLDLIRDAAEDSASLMIIGHNPGMEDLTDELAGSGKPEYLRQLRAKFPTCVVAVLRSPEPWARWGSNCASLVDLHTP